MGFLRRATVGAATIGTLLFVMAGAALAGNFAEVTYVDGADEPPRAGEERDISFVLLQHGVAPIDDGQVELVLVNSDSGEELTVPATPRGDGRWTASVVFPSAGDWEVGVRHEWFSTSEPIAMAVAPPEAALGGLRPVLAASAFAAAALLLGVMFMGRRPRARPVITPAEEPARAHG